MAAAQCQNAWLPGIGLPGTNGQVGAAIAWDRDGAGPLPPVAVISGDFTIAGDRLAQRIAIHDPATGTWSTLGTGMSGPFLGQCAVHALAVLPGGDLVAAGQFLEAGGVQVANIARWDGTAWHGLGSGIGGLVRALTVRPNGDLVAVGAFDVAGGVAVDDVARWDGANWWPMASAVVGDLTAVAAMPDGDVVVGGLLQSIAGVPVAAVARWNGNTWHPLGAGLGNAVFALHALPNGDLVAGGAFLTAGGTPAAGVARWDGLAWHALGNGIHNPVYAISSLANGDLIAGGVFEWVDGSQAGGGTAASRIARWDGSAWSPLGAGMSGPVHVVAPMPDGTLVAGGNFARAGGVPARSFALWDGSAWIPLAGLDGAATCIVPTSDGGFLVGGEFTRVGSVVVGHIARWTGSAWAPLGTGVGGPVYAVAVAPNGDVIAGGAFTTAGGVAASRIARWNGTTWAPLGPGLDNQVRAVAALPSGAIVAAGPFTGGLSRWDGSGWGGMGVTSAWHVVVPIALAVLPDGDLVVASSTLSLPSRVARWNGTTWTQMPSLWNALALLPGPDGALYSVSYDAVRVLPAAGSTWTVAASKPTSLGGLQTLALLPGGDLVVGGTFVTSASPSLRRLARWDGTSWSALGSGADGPVTSVAVLAGGDLVVGGDFTVVDGQVRSSLARMTTTCPAVASVLGIGCAGSAGPLALVAESLPWTGGVFRSRASGLPWSSLALPVLGWTSIAAPLSAALPQAGASCSLYVVPDLLELAVPTAGQLPLQVAVPDTVALAGLVAHQQVVVLELDAGGALLASTSTNALTLTVGTF